MIGEGGEQRGAAGIYCENQGPRARPNEAALSKYDFTPPHIAVCAFDQVLTFYSAYFILRVRITIEYQLQVRDVFSIRLETSCPVGTKPSVEVQHFRTCDDEGPKRPIETQRLLIAGIPAGAETKEGEAPPVSLCRETKDGIRLLFPCL